MTQRQIDAAHRRSLKTKYGHLSPAEKQLVKLREDEKNLTLSIDREWRHVASLQDPPYTPETTPGYILDKLDFILDWESRREKVLQRIDRLVAKHNLDESYIAQVHMMANIAPGGSY